MTDVALRVSTAVTLLWLGMVLAISFLEAPLKFRAPGVDLRTGLAIGRIVFRALNGIEVVWAAVLAATLIADAPNRQATIAALVTIAVLAAQLSGVRPRLNRRSDRVLAGEHVPRSSAHHVYIALEAVKVAGLILLAGILLAS
jgi:hypothetical protein